ADRRGPPRSRSSYDARQNAFDLRDADRALSQDLDLIRRAVDDGRRDAARRRAPVEHKRDASLELRDHLLRRSRVGLSRAIGARHRKTAPARRDEAPRERMVRYAERHRAASWRDQDDGERTRPEALREGPRDRRDDRARLEVPGIREQHRNALLLRTVLRAVQLAHVLVSSR